MNASPLPYDMGNAGDLIKHGMIAEFTQWWLEGNRGGFVFVDPFGGRPFAEPSHEQVVRRLGRLPDCALKVAQPDYRYRYYGSSNVVRNICRSKSREARIYVSDRDPNAMGDLLAAGFAPLQWLGFDPGDSFSIINCEPAANHNRVSLLLMDPFDDFLPDYAERVVPALAKFIIANNTPIMLFVLSRNGDGEGKREHEDEINSYGQWCRLRARYFTKRVTQVSLACRRIIGSAVKGEANLDAEALLLLPASGNNDRLTPLVSRLDCFRDYLSWVLGQTIELTISS